jgi:regulator of sigma E protease
VLLTLLAALVVLGPLIFVHEHGHFLAAKLTGVGDIRFSIGFGPPTPLRFRRGGCEYVVSWILFGGYVMMASEEGVLEDGVGGGTTESGAAAHPAFPPEQLFEHKPLWMRLLVISAGVTMNALFAGLLYAGLAAWFGRQEDRTTTIAEVDTAAIPPYAKPLAELSYPLTLVRINHDTVASWNVIQETVLDPTASTLAFHFAGRAEPVVLSLPGTPGEDRYRLLSALKPAWAPRVGAVAPGRPAARAGLRPGDLVVSANGDGLRYWEDLVRVIESHPGDTVTLVLARRDSLFTARVVPEAQQDSDLAGGGRRVVGKVGIGPQVDVRHVRFGPAAALREGARRTLADARVVGITLWQVITRRVSPRELGGPILIGQVSGQLVRLGVEPFLAFVALLSVNLAVLNLLPIPVLDGGRLVFLLAEGVRGRPLSRRLRIQLSNVGVALLLAILVYVVTNDLLRIWAR